MKNYNENFVRMLWKDKAVVHMFDTKEHDWVEDFKIDRCHVSFQNLGVADQTEANAIVSQRVVLFCAVDLDIKPGSRIVATLRNGRDYEFLASGIPATYDWHQEINLIKENDA